MSSCAPTAPIEHDGRTRGWARIRDRLDAQAAEIAVERPPRGLRAAYDTVPRRGPAPHDAGRIAPVADPAEEHAMNPAPKWYLPVAILALLWTLLGCAAYLGDVMLTPDDIAKMSPDQQALYAARPAWAVAATAIAVWGGAAGCLGLVLRKRWALPLLLLSLAGVIVQDVALFVLSSAAAQAGTVAYVLQGLVLAIAIGLVLLARRAIARGWIA